MSVFERCHQGVARQEAGKGGEVGGKIKWRLSEVNTRAVSRGQDNKFPCALLVYLCLSFRDLFIFFGNSFPPFIIK